MEITREIAEQIHSQVVKAQDLAGAGKLAEAGKILAKALELCPEHPDANQVMGLLCFQQQKYQAARDHLRASLKGVPDQPFVLASLGQVLIELKDLGGARGAFLKAIEAMPELGAAYGFLSEISRKQDLASLTGKIIQVFLNVEDLNPLTKVQLGFALTTCLEKLGQTEKAADTKQYYRHMQEVVKNQGRPVELPHPPEDVKTALLRARDHLTAANYRRAEKISRKLLQQDASQADALAMLALTKSYLNEYDTAIEVYRKALELSPNQPKLWIKLGIAYNNIREFENSEHCHKMAVLYDPRSAEAIYWLGNAALGRGDDRLAQFYLEKAISITPGFSQPYDLLGRINSFKADDKFLAALEKNAENVDRSRVDSIFAHYALGSHYYRNKEREKFIHHVTRANALQKELAPIIIDKNIALAGFSKKIFTSGLLDRQAGQDCKLITPIFIVGLPRSGSTLVEQILSRHRQVAAGDEIHFLYSHILTGVEKETGQPYPEGLDKITSKSWCEIGRAYQKRLSQIAPKAPFITDKQLSNALYVGLIRLALPWAKVIHVNRNPMDRALSIYSNHFNEALPYCFDLKHLARHTKLIKWILDFWRERIPGFILDLEYEDLVADIEGQTRRILDFCGLQWDPGCLEFYKSERTVLTISIGQVHKPIYSSSIGKWKQYADLLEPFRVEMGELIDQDGFLAGKG